MLTVDWSLLSADDAQRFWANVAIGDPTDCWEWVGTRHIRGYGRFQIQGTSQAAHRVALALTGRPPASPREVARHSCDNPPCVNPAHLQLGTQADNMRDMAARGRAAGGRIERARTRCPEGHPYDEANTYWTPSGTRQCRRCHAITKAVGRENTRHAKVRRWAISEGLEVAPTGLIKNDIYALYDAAQQEAS